MQNITFYTVDEMCVMKQKLQMNSNLLECSVLSSLRKEFLHRIHYMRPKINGICQPVMLKKTTTKNHHYVYLKGTCTYELACSP